MVKSIPVIDGFKSDFRRGHRLLSVGRIFEGTFGSGGRQGFGLGPLPSEGFGEGGVVSGLTDDDPLRVGGEDDRASGACLTDHNGGGAGDGCGPARDFAHLTDLPCHRLANRWAFRRSPVIVVVRAAGVADQKQKPGPAGSSER